MTDQQQNQDKQTSTRAFIAQSAQTLIAAKAKRLGVTATPPIIDSVTLHAIEIWENNGTSRQIYFSIQERSELLLRREQSAGHIIRQLLDRIEGSTNLRILMPQAI